MNTETNNGGDQQTQPGAAAGATTDAANPNTQPVTAPADVDGQGDGGTKTGEDAGKTGGEGEKGAGDGQQKPEATGAPEQYEQFTVPEGYVLEGPRLELAVEKFKGWGFTQAQAQEAIDAFCKADGENATIMQQAAEAAIAQKREAWADQARQQLGDKFDAEVGLAKTALASLNNPALVEAFETEGWGNHPELIKVFAHFGRLSRDSGMDGVGSPGGTQAPRSIEDRMYPGKT